MNKLFLLRTFIATFSIAILILIAGTEVFHGNEKTDFQKHTETSYDYDETDPYIDRPTSEARMHLTENDDVLDIITDATGFDNFEIGVDFAEQMLVSNPTNPLNMQFGVNSGGSGQNAYYTTNGHDWTSSNPAYHASTCCDPWSAFDSLGNLFYGSGVSNQYVYKSTNGGQTYGPAVLSVSGNDRNTLAADQTGGPYKNYLYAAITPGNFARSTNNGTSWTTTYSPSNTIPGTMIAVGPNGSTQGGCVMYVTNTGSTANVTYTFHRSTNGGANFTVMSTLTVAGYVGTLNTAGRLVINNGRTRPYPMIAMDNSYGPYRGRLYLVYASNVPAGNGNKPDIILQYSTNQGSTWSSRITVNDNANPQLSDQWFPAIWCEKETGRLYIKWYDTRENPATYAVNVYATYTDDGGNSFAANQKLTTTSWTYPNPACAPNTNCYRGDYDGMTANPKTSFSVWYDGRLGTYKNVGAYFPDYAMTVSPTAANIHNTNDFKLIDVNIPAVKLYTDNVNFTTAVTPVPGTGSIVADFPSGNSLSAPYPKTAKMRVRTIGTVTNGVYTVTVTGSGPNGTPVHKRNVTLTVGNTLSSVPCQDFASANIPTSDLNVDYSGTIYWSRLSQSAYGSGLGSARFNAWSAPAGTVQSLVSNSFNAVAANTYLTFDNAYRPWSGGNIDSLILEYSTNFGSTYIALEKLWGGLGAQAGPLNTVFTGGSQFTPANHEWRSKIYLLPVGTNKIRLRAVSGFGNDIFVDNVCVQNLSAPSGTSSIGLVPEGFYRALPFPQAVQDSIRVYLHRADFPNIAVDSAVSYYNAGAIASNPFTRALSGTYYIVLKHRNSLETWSKSGGQVYTRGNIFSFNFIQPVGQAYNNNQELIDPAPFYGMYGGDLNKDHLIDVADVSQIDNAAFNFLSGYVIEDLTGDNFTDINDLAIAEKNASNFVTRQTPPGANLSPVVSEELLNPAETEFENDAMRQKYELTVKLLNEQKVQEKIKQDLQMKKDQETELRKKNINSFREKMRKNQNTNETVKPEITIPERPGRTLGQ